MIPIDVHVETKFTRTPRVIQLEGIFDVPPRGVLQHEWKGSLPIDERDWNVGLIVGPSGAGKSSIASAVFGESKIDKWKAQSVIDDFSKALSIEKITQACSAVGFNTIPSWMKPYSVLSTGEKFRVQIARAILERSDPIVMDEFTSVVDRQVAHVGSHAVQKFIRKHKRKFVAVTCHYDVIEWLQPDWILEPATMTFRWRSVRRRPDIDVEIARVDYAAWKLFAPFHYLTAELHRAANCFVLFANGEPASFAAVLHRPHASVRDIKGISRIVTLPDYQGLGLAMILSDALGSMYSALGYRFHQYPAHASFVRVYDNSKNWAMVKRPGVFSPKLGATSTLGRKSAHKKWNMGSRPCAVFRYVGPIEHSKADAAQMIGE